MLHIGLTGGIGSGKSTAARAFDRLGAYVIDSDVLAREVVAPGSDGLAEVAHRFGGAVLDPSGSLDRAALAAIVFGDADARRDLEAITHPRIAALAAQRLDAAPADAVVVHDVPLLVEKAMGARYHLVVVVDAPASVRLRRLTEQRGMAEGEALARIEHQATDEQRRRAADVLLRGTGSPEELDAAVSQLWTTRLVPYEQNIRRQVRVRRPETPLLAPSSVAWADQADRLIARLSHVLGHRAPEIEHIGSTSVPGLPARDVIDLQIGVGDLRQADEPEFVDALAAAGFPRSEGNSLDHPSDAVPDPAEWVKRFHGSCDPGRLVHLHIRELGGAGWQYALLHRDWLRADQSAVQAYAEHKRHLASVSPDTDTYVRAKQEWFGRSWPQMQEFARRTGWHD